MAEANVPPTRKTCSTCHDTKAPEAFPLKGQQCKACIASKNKRWQLNNPDKAHAKEHAWRRNNRQKINATRKTRRIKKHQQALASAEAWRLANPEQAAAQDQEQQRQKREKTRARKKASRLKNREKIRAGYKAWRLKNPTYAQARRLKDLEQARAKDKAWRRANPEKERAKDKAWRHRNPEKVRAKRHRRRARINGFPASFTNEEQHFCRAYFQYACAACGNEEGFQWTIVMDHWIPIASSACPGTISTNMIPLCHGVGGCNTIKKDTPPEQWLFKHFGKRKARQILKKIEAYFQLITLKGTQ